MLKRGWSKTWLFVAGAIVVTACGQSGGSAPADKSDIKIGVIFPLSGALAQGGKDNLNGVQAAVDELNAGGGLNGRKVQLDVADAPDPATAVSAANRLITQDGVKVVIGTVSSDLALAAAPVANRNKVVYWEVEAVSNKLTSEGLDYFFRTVPNSAALGSTATQYTLSSVAQAVGISPKDLKVAVTSVAGAYGSDTTQGVVDELKRQGVNPVDVETYEATVKDFTPLILKLRSLHPDVVISTSYPADSILFMKQSKQLDFHFKALVGTGAGQTTAQFAQALGPDVNGVVSSSFPVDVNASALNAKGKAQRDRFTKEFTAKYGSPPDIGAQLAYIGTEDLFTVMAKAGGDAPDKVRAAALAVDEPLGNNLNGWGLKFDKTGQNLRSPVFVVQWQAGDLHTIFPTNVATASLKGIPLQ